MFPAGSKVPRQLFALYNKYYITNIKFVKDLIPDKSGYCSVGHAKCMGVLFYVAIFILVYAAA